MDYFLHLPKIIYIILLILLIIGSTIYLIKSLLMSERQIKSEDKINHDFYIKSKKLEDDKNIQNSIPEKEKEEISWKFLLNTIKKVNVLFSNEDKKIVEKLGDILYKTGLRYQHDVEYELSRQIANKNITRTEKVNNKQKHSIRR